MDITDIIGKGPSLPRPVHPDMDRVIEIVLEMKAITSENRDDPEAFHRLWREQIEKSINFDVLAYQAVQVACQVYNINTGADFTMLKLSPMRMTGFVHTLQAFYDGFLLGVQFQERGGKR